MPTLSLLLLAAIFQSSPAADVTVEAIGPQEWRLTATVTGAAEPAVAMQRLLPTAVQLCGALTPRFGRYKFSARAGLEGDTSEPDAVVLVQALRGLSCAC